MAEARIVNVLPTFPVGTTVKAYVDVRPDGGWPHPVGGALDSAVVNASGGLTFTSLPEMHTLYAAAAEIAGAWHFTYFTSEGGGEDLELSELQELVEEHIVDHTGVHGITDTAELLTKADVTQLVENTGNKVQALSGESEIEYPSEKAVQLGLAGKQPLDADLTSISALTTTEIGRSLLAIANAAAGRTILGVDAALGYTAENAANKDTDAALAANSDVKYASQKAVKAYVDGLLAASDAVVYKGVKDCSASPNYPAASAGHLYVVSVAGKIGGAAGIEVEAGDMFICKTDGTAAGTQAEVGAQWNVIQTNLVGAVTGPASAVSAQLAAFNGTTGKIIQDSGKAVTTSGTLAGNSDSNLPTEKAVKTYADAGDALAIAKTFIAAKGDLIAASANDTPLILTVGTNGQILAADSAQSSGLKYVDNKTIEEHTFAIPGEITTASGEGLRHFVFILTGQVGELVRMRARLGSGTSATCKLQKGGVDATGFTALEAKSTEDVAKEPTAVALANNDAISLVVTAVSGTPKNLTVTFGVLKSRS